MRSAGERLLEILNRYKADEVSRAETLNDVVRVYRSLCDGCKYRTEANRLEEERKNLLKGIDDGF